MTIFWTNGSGGFWSTPSNWLGDSLPETGSDVDIDATPTGTSYTVTLDSSVNISVDSLTLIAAATLLGTGGDLTVTDAASTSDIAGTIDVSSGQISLAGTVGSLGLIEATGIGVLGLTGATLLQTQSGTATVGTLEVTGTDETIGLASTDIVGGDMLSSGGGEFATSFGQQATLDATTAAISLSGTVAVGNNSVLWVGGSLNMASGTIVLSASNYDAEMILFANTTLSGGAQLVLGDSANDIVTAVGTAPVPSLHIASGTVSGGGQLGGGNMGLLVMGAGLIDANGTANELVINLGTGGFSNWGRLEATSGPGLEIHGDKVDNTTTIGGTVANAGSILASGGSVLLTDGTSIRGGTLATASGSAIHVTFGNSATLDGTATGAGNSHATINDTGLIDLDNNGGLTLEGTIGGGGTISLNASNYSAFLTIAQVGTVGVTLLGKENVLLGGSPNDNIIGAGGTDDLTLSSATISGGGGIEALTLINQSGGTIDANNTAEELQIRTNANASTNAGLIEATGSASLGIVDSTITNTGSIAAATGGVVHVDNSIIRGGSIVAGGGGVQTDFGETATLDGSSAPVTLTGTYTVTNAATLGILGSIVNKGSILLAASNYLTALEVVGASATLTGAGQVVMSDSTNNYLTATAATDVLVNVNNVISGAGQLGDGQLSLTNQAAGTIDATGTNALTVSMGAGTFSNAGLVEATGTSTLVIYATTIANTGIVEANGIGAAVDLQAGASIRGGTIETPTATSGSLTGNGVVQVVYGSSGTLDGSGTGGILNLGTVAADNNSSLDLLGTLTNKGTVWIASSNYNTALVVASATATLTGGGDVVLNDSPNSAIFADTQTVDSVVTVYSLVNVNNVISGAGSFGEGQLNVDNQAAGTIDATGSNALVINVGTGDTFTNEGLIEASNPNSLSATGGLVIYATTIDDTGNSNGGVVLANGAVVHLQGGSVIRGGTVSTEAGGVVAVDYGHSAVLDGSSASVTVAGTVQASNNGSLLLRGTIVNDGTLLVASSNYGTALVLDAPVVTLTGAGNVVLNDTVNSYLDNDNTGQKLVNVNNTISGSGHIGGAGMTLDNQAKGTIDANGSNAQLTIDLTGFTNEGLVEDTGSAGLVITSTTVTNAGTIEAAGAGSSVTLEGAADIVGGKLGSTGGGVVVVPYGQTATLGAAGGTITLFGTVAMANNGVAALVGTVLNTGTLLVAASNYGTVLLADAATVTLSGGGQVSMADSGNSIIEGAAGSDKLVNVNNTIAGSGRIGNGAMALDNQAGGLIDATGSAAQLVLNLTTATNEGVIEDTGSAGLVIAATSITNSGTIKAVGSGAFVDLQAGATIRNGTITTSGGGRFQVDFGQTATLNGTGAGVTNTGTVVVTNNGLLAIMGTVGGNGTLSLAASNYVTALEVDASTATLRGTGTVLMGDNSNNAIESAAATDELINVNDTIIGSGRIGNGELSIDNQASGKIIANGVTAGMTINVGAGTFSNEGLVETTGTEGLFIASTITNTGSILAAGAGTFIQLSAGADIIGGTFGGTGGGVAYVPYGNQATLDGTNTITVVGTVEAANNGVLALIGHVVNDGTLAALGSNYGTVLYVDSAAVTLTGGGQVLLGDSGNSFLESAAAADELVNVNNTITGSGRIGNGQLSIDNQASGKIIANGVAAGMTIYVGAGTFSNEGLIETTGTEGLYIGSTITNTGSILAAGAGTFIQLNSGADIVGGTFGGTGGGVAYVPYGNQATLDGTHTITLDGTVEAANNGVLDLIGTANNTGTLVVQASNFGTELQILSATATLTGGGRLAMADSTNTYVGAAASGDVLVNLNNLIVGAGTLGGNGLDIDNRAAGVIEGDGGNVLVIVAPTISNEGTIEATTTAGVRVGESQLTNFGFSGTAATLTGGSYVASNGTINITGSGFATFVDAGNITLGGVGGQATSEIMIGGTSLDAILTTVANGGQFFINGARSYLGAQALSIAAGGTVRIGGGSFGVAVGGISNAGRIYGAGGLATTGVATLDNTGTIEAYGGKLKVGALTGDGVLKIDAASTLEVAVATSENAIFNGAGAVLKLDKPTAYTGTLDGVAPGSILDLTGVTVTGAKFSGDTLVVQTASNGTLTFALGAAPTTNELLAFSNTTTDGFVTVYGLAQPSTATPTPISFGNRHQGTTVTQALTLGNTAPNNGYYEKLDAGISATGTGVTTSGTITGLAAGSSNNSTLVVKLATGSDGVQTGTVLVAETSDGTGIDGLPVTVLPTQTIAATGTVWAYASPKLSTGSLTFTNVRVGATAQTLDVTLNNGTVADPFQESLIYAETLPSGILGAVGATGGTITSGGSVTLGFVLNTGSSGAYNGASVAVGETSDALATGLTNTKLGGGTVKITGTVYQQATASAATTLNFGVVHVGDTISDNFAVTNTATGAVVDAVTGSVASISGTTAVTASGSLNVASLGTGSIAFKLNTSTAASIAGNATLDLFSHDSQLADIALPTDTIALSGTVNNYATATITRSSGPSGNPIVGGGITNLYMTAVAGSTLSDKMQVANTATGPADLLSGNFTISGAIGTFTNTGFGSVSDLAAGASINAVGTVSLSTIATGLSFERIVLNAFGTNDSGYNGAVQAQTVDVFGGVANAVLTGGTDHVALAGNDVILAGGGALSTGDVITAGTGSNTLLLMAGGAFNLATPTTLTGITSVTAFEGQAAYSSGGLSFTSQSQTVTLRSGLNVTVNVSAEPSVLVNAANPNPASIVINGANDSSVMNLGAGADTVNLGAATETVNGGTGSGTVNATAATAGATVDGMSGNAVRLVIGGGGTATLNNADSNVAVVLSAKTNLSLGTASFVSAMGQVAGNSITAGAANQTLGGTAGGDTLTGFSGFGDTFLGNSAGLNNDTIVNFGGSDTIDVTDLLPSASVIYSGTTNGTLTLNDGTHSLTLKMTGTYQQSDFAIGTDSHTGSFITFV